MENMIEKNIELFDNLVKVYGINLVKDINRTYRVQEQDGYEVHLNKDNQILYVFDGVEYIRYVYGSNGNLLFKRHCDIVGNNYLSQYDGQWLLYEMQEDVDGKYKSIIWYNRDGKVHLEINEQNEIYYKYNSIGELVMKQINGVDFIVHNMLPFDFKIDKK